MSNMQAACSYRLPTGHALHCPTLHLIEALAHCLQAAKSREEKLGPRDPAMVKSFQRFANAAAVGMPSLVAATHGDPHCYEKTLKVRILIRCPDHLCPAMQMNTLL